MAPSFSRSQLEMSPKMSELPSPVVPLSLLSPRTELSRSITIVFLTQHDGTVATIKEFRFIASFSVCFSLVQFERRKRVFHVMHIQATCALQTGCRRYTVECWQMSKCHSSWLHSSSSTRIIKSPVRPPFAATFPIPLPPSPLQPWPPQR